LRYDKRSGGPKGRCLIRDLPELGLLQDDRLEPTPELWDVGALEDMGTPCVVTFWRPSLVSLLQLIRGFVGRNWRAYVLAGLMLFGVALLTVWLPRKVGQVIDVLAAGQATPASLARDMALLLGAGVVIYLLRAGWRLQRRLRNSAG
jgi:hypothetical protein